MGENSKIEWTTHTFNPWIGCTRVSPGCVNCYAEKQDERWNWTQEGWGPGAPRKRTGEGNWNKPVKWNRDARRKGIRERVFCASLADIFDADVEQGWRDDLWALIEETTSLDWLLLTKRPQNIGEMIPESWLENWPLNVWLGVTVENQRAADERIPILLSYPAPVRFLSCEPLIDRVDLEFDLDGVPVLEGIDWIIAGGESGNEARPMHPRWVLDLLQAATVFDVAFFFKQWGKWAPVEVAKPGDLIHYLEVDREPVNMRALGKKHSGRSFEGGTFSDFPTPINRNSTT